MKRMYVGIIVFILLIIVIVTGTLLLKRHDQQQGTILSGITETRHIDVASKIPGRIDSVFIGEGDYVTKGERLASLESKEVSAKLEQARGAMDAAHAKMSMAKNGLRPKEQEAALKLYLQAKAQYDLLDKTYNRVVKLLKDSVISSQEKDQVEAQYIGAREQMDAAKVKYDLAMEGARVEERDAAQSLYYQAQNVYNEAMAYSSERNITCPVSGEVEKIIADPGEIIGSGYPLLTIIDTSEIWVIIQVKENIMAKFKKGTELSGSIPALNNEQYLFYVNYISPMADFATWRPTNQKGEFDIRTFEIHLKPKTPITGLRPGMTVNYLIKK